MDKSLNEQISDLKLWREQLSQSISDYRDWLGIASPDSGIEELRLFDIEQTLKKDKLVLAFVAEFSRGKTETINALFFSEFEQRLLPSNPGRTTMCPTEIFWDDLEEPCIKLLPIETRESDDSLSLFKSMPQAWVKIRLDINSPSQLKEAFKTIVAQKEVPLDQANKLGLWNETDLSKRQALEAYGKIDIPVWRHALINFPHPLLQNGLVILDTPGLNALGAEPELTLNIISNAQAVIFLMATDTGVTKSDMQVWTQHIGNHHNRKVAILNKIDILWDKLKSQAEIDAEINAQIRLTAKQLNLDPAYVLAMSAQKGLLAKIKKDAGLLKRSGILKVEKMLAENVVAAKHEILRSTVVAETSNLIKNSRKLIQHRIGNARHQLSELQNLRGQNRDVIEGLLTDLRERRKLYDASVASFNTGNSNISKLGRQLRQLIEEDTLQQLLKDSRREIGDRWTTIGLNQSIKKMIEETREMSLEINRLGEDIQRQAENLYQLFSDNHQFEKRIPPKLDLSEFNLQMADLGAITDAFCSDPINVMTEKYFLIRRFFLSLGQQVEAIFSEAHHKAELWIKSLLAPLKQQIEEYKEHLDKRSRSLMQIHQNTDNLQAGINSLEQTLSVLQEQGAMLDKLLLKLMTDAKSGAPVTKNTSNVPEMT